MFARVLLVCLCAAAARALAAGPLVRTAHGVLSGSWQLSSGGRTYASFQGVPYARPPVGKYRFREPQRLKPWVGTWDASQPHAACLQYNPFALDPDNKIEGSEDCLFVNVYTPQPSAAVSLPVVVFIHGGAFMYGSARLYGPQYLMEHDIVAVTINYRLGPLGFLSTGDEMAPGNMGLKDQAFALRWIQENIAMFGGNPDSVTLTGLSAGGASVHYHYLSPLSQGLFARGIAHSGSALAPWTLASRPAEKARALAAHVGCPTAAATTRDMLDCLRHRPAEAIVQAQTIFFEWRVHMFNVFVPCVEPAAAREPFLPRHPLLLARGAAARAPLVASVTSEEGLYPAASYQSDPNLLPELEAHWTQLASEIFVYNDTLPQEQQAAVAEKIKTHYLQGRPLTQDTYPQLVKALSDRLFVADVGLAAQIHAAKSGQPVYLYRYSFRGEKSLSNLMAGDTQNYGVSHGDDVFHIWKFPGLEMERADDLQMRQLLIDMLFSYASSGTPRVGGGAWTPLGAGAADLQYVEIGAPGVVEARAAPAADFGERAFWESLGFAENDRAQLAARDEL